MTEYTPLYTYAPKNAVKLAGTLTTVAIGDAEPVSIQGFLQIPEIGHKAETIDQTTIEDEYERTIAGMFKGEEREIELVDYDGDANQAALKAAAQAGKIVTFVHQWKNGTKVTYQATLLGMTMSSGGNEDLVKFKISMKLNGKPTFSKAAPVTP